jgi:ribosomal protein S18 acetylase RimI-like enzyme
MAFIAEYQGRPAGYLTCHVAGPGQGQIDLIGVDPALRGRGLGWLLLDHSVLWLLAHGGEHVTVVTQGTNIQAQQMYQKVGFLLAQTQVWFHRWFQPEQDENA